MRSVHLSGPYNSTMFTDCCGTAICDHQPKCPRCGGYVYPDSEGDTDRSDHARHLARWGRAFGPYRKAARQGRWHK